MQDDKIDWDAVELDYRAGVLPISGCAKKHNISVGQLKSKAHKYMWERRPMDPLTLKQAHGVASSPSPAKFGMDSNFTAPDVVQAAILTAATVLDIHRKDVKSLREMGNKFSTALADLFRDMEAAAISLDAVETLQLRVKALGLLMGDKSPSDLLEQLSRVMVRLVAIERQAYGLDVMPNPDPGAEATDQKVQSQVNKLWEQIQVIQKVKTSEAVH